jgi:hypothetical protein
MAAYAEARPTPKTFAAWSTVRVAFSTFISISLLAGSLDTFIMPWYHSVVKDSVRLSIYKDNFRGRLEQSGMVSDIGLLASRPVESRHLIPATIQLVRTEEEVFLKWEMFGPNSERPSLRTDFVGALDRFINLADAPPERILQFAREWGVLNLCGHRLPYTHRPLPPPSADNPFRDFLPPEPMVCRPVKFELASVWRDHAHRLKAILQAAANLHLGKTGEPADWAVIEPWHEPTESWWNEQARAAEPLSTVEWSGITLQKMHLEFAVSGLIADSGAKPFFYWPLNRPPTITVLSGGLPSVLAIQVAFAIVGGKTFASCTSCGKLYEPERKPQAGRRNYCSDCRATAPKRDYARRRREAEKHER